MKPEEVVEFFETQEKAALALGVTQQAISAWLKRGEIPELRKYQIEKITKGKIKCQQ